MEANKERWSIGDHYGIININKEKGYTSHDVVAILRKKLNTKKIGHTGTLDPDATGVLPICVGKATKVAEYLVNKTKTYQVTYQLGFVTDTQDISGEVLEKYDVNVTEEEILDAIHLFLGQYDQIPPMYSALKVNGRKLYEIARSGETVERKARRINIYSIENIEVNNDIIKMDVTCSKGTYIRTLCYDIGKKLSCGATMTELVRTKSGIFTIETALKLSEVDELIESNQLLGHLYSVENVFDKYEKVRINGQYNRFLYNGNKLPRESIMDNVEIVLEYQYRVYDENSVFIGVYQCIEYKESIVLKAEKLFL